MASDKRYQWLLIALLSANFGVVFFDRNAFSFLAPFIQPDLKLTQHADRLTRRGVLVRLGDCGPVHGHAVGPDRPAQADPRDRDAGVLRGLGAVGLCAAFVMMLGARMLMGIAEGGIMPITQTLIAAEVAPERRGLAHGITQNFGANLLANFLGPIVDRRDCAARWAGATRSSSSRCRAS